MGHQLREVYQMTTFTLEPTAEEILAAHYNDMQMVDETGKTWNDIPKDIKPEVVSMIVSDMIARVGAEENIFEEADPEILDF